MILLIFSSLSLVFLVLAYRTKHSKKPVNLWANDKSEIIVTDIRKHNHACAKLFVIYSIMLFVSGLICSLNHVLYTVLSMLLTVFSSIALIASYTFIEGKYRK